MKNVYRVNLNDKHDIWRILLFKARHSKGEHTAEELTQKKTKPNMENVSKANTHTKTWKSSGIKNRYLIWIF